MGLYTMYVFNAKGKCLYYKAWHRPYFALAGSPDEDTKLCFGFIFSLSQLRSKMSPTPDAPGAIKRVVSSSYALHMFDSATGYKIVLTSSKDVQDLQPALSHIYTELFCPFVVLNPLYTLGDVITCPAFVDGVDAYIKRHPAFVAPPPATSSSGSGSGSGAAAGTGVAVAT